MQLISEDQKARRVKWLQAVRSRPLRYEQDKEQVIIELRLQSLLAKTLYHEKVEKPVFKLQDLESFRGNYTFVKTFEHAITKSFHQFLASKR